MKYKAVLLLILAAVFPLLSGCWSRLEVENLAIVAGLGIDKTHENGKEMYSLTVNTLRPSLISSATTGGGSKGMPNFWRVTAKGESLADAEKNINTRIPRKVFYGHDRFVIIGEDAAKDGLLDIIDYLQRNTEIRLRILMLLTKGKAENVMIQFPELETTIAREIEEMERITSKDVSKVLIRDLVKITDDIISPGVDPVLAQVIIQLSPPTQAGGGPIKILKYVGGGVIREDKLVGWLDEIETRGYMFAIGKALRSAISIKVSPGPGKDASIYLTRASSNIKTSVKGQEVTAHIEIKAEGELAEYHKQDKIAKPAGIRKLEEGLGKEIQQEVMQAFKKGQKLNADIFGLGDNMHKHNSKTWEKMNKDWYKILPNVKIDVKVSAHVRRTGFISNPYIAR
ncbi:MAG: Ger(x)C family spore germination protein [Eubacteriales bacterium]